MKRVPQRTCVGCRQVRPKQELVRIVRTPQGEVRVDVSGKLPGRGAYVCPRLECAEAALRQKRLARSLGVAVAPAILDEMKERLRESKAQVRGEPGRVGAVE
jgi:predicted RNA-binding protein YlxR (DUF448 family)